MNLYSAIKDRIQGKAPKGTKRSSRWRKVRQMHIKLWPKCEVCCSKRKLHVHHIVPFYMAPELELNSRNLITLCSRCHLFIGHLGDYRCINTSCISDIADWKLKFDERC